MLLHVLTGARLLLLLLHSLHGLVDRTVGTGTSALRLWLLLLLLFDVGVTELAMLVHEVVARKLAAAYLAGIVLHVQIQQSHLTLLGLRLRRRSLSWRLNHRRTLRALAAVSRQQVATRVLPIAVLRLEGVTAVAAGVAASTAVVAGALLVLGVAAAIAVGAAIRRGG